MAETAANSVDFEKSIRNRTTGLSIKAAKIVMYNLSLFVEVIIVIILQLTLLHSILQWIMARYLILLLLVSLPSILNYFVLYRNYRYTFYFQDFDSKC